MENTRTRTHARNEKDDLLPVSKDCSQQGKKTEKKKTEGEKHFLYHCSSSRTLTEEASLRTTTQRRQHNNNNNNNRFWLVLPVFFSTLSLFLYALGLHSVVAGISSAPRWREKNRKMLHVVQKKKRKRTLPIYFRWTCWMLPRTPSPSPSTRLKRSLFLLLNHQTGPTLSWTFKCNIFSLFSILLLLIFVHYYWCYCFLFCFFVMGKDQWLKLRINFIC